MRLASGRELLISRRAMGYRGHSVKIGAHDSEGGPALDAARIDAALADRQPGEYFIADANGGLTPETALRMLALLPPGLDFALEAPCATWQETASLRSTCSEPLILDELADSEATIIQAIAEDVADGSSVVTASFTAPVEDGGVLAPDEPGLGITPDLDVLGSPVASWS